MFRFELVDMFLCCKFAEGDSRILRMKLMRDRLKVIHFAQYIDVTIVVYVNADDFTANKEGWNSQDNKSNFGLPRQGSTCRIDDCSKISTCWKVYCRACLFGMLLVCKLQLLLSRDLKKMDELFTQHWEEIYHLASLIEDRHIANVPGKKFLEPIEVRFRPSSLKYDMEWKNKLGKK